jgi:hypothetical protein
MIHSDKYYYHGDVLSGGANPIDQMPKSLAINSYIVAESSNDSVPAINPSAPADGKALACTLFGYVNLNT